MKSNDSPSWDSTNITILSYTWAFLSLICSIQSISEQLRRKSFLFGENFWLNVSAAAVEWWYAKIVPSTQAREMALNCNPGVHLFKRMIRSWTRNEKWFHHHTRSSASLVRLHRTGLDIAANMIQYYSSLADNLMMHCNQELLLPNYLFSWMSWSQKLQWMVLH